MNPPEFYSLKTMYVVLEKNAKSFALLTVNLFLLSINIKKEAQTTNLSKKQIKRK